MQPVHLEYDVLLVQILTIIMTIECSLSEILYGKTKGVFGNAFVIS